ncbi:MULTISPECIES: NAD(P)/FAD-dependent oxidoreductase [Rhodococcus]|uniref:flavin monoamine oxidase family protein n=1 Tax=Rhodococcus TaxID=1827 RepID=UPI00143E17BB|nr:MULTISPECIES: NAD(P)/FAD-dependent oxidoreductase [Rhodococcus]MBC2591703.1 FAD-dependent oxidoreductase [Rhodococcus aetherivorans]QIX49052.1 FAD-dependent oxidoreductase [Rhodococcus sp. DMU1]
MKIIVVGAGFAGLVAARELTWTDHDVTVLEARDRIGGRTWTDTRLGMPLEMGGTWVHWMQGYVWAEMKRYGQTVVESPRPAAAYWISAGTVHAGTEEELDGKLLRPQEAIFAGSRTFFPRPADCETIFRSSEDADLVARYRAMDAGNVLDAVRGGDFTQEEIDLVDAYWSAANCGPSGRASAAMAQRWVSLSDHRLSLLDDCTLRYKLENGMRDLYENIAADTTADIRLNSVVRSIVHGADSATVTLTDGDVLTADAVVVTVPITALREISFEPPLPEDATAVVEEGLNSTGVKIWARLRGEHSFIAYAPSGYPLSLVRSEYSIDGDTIAVGFGPDASVLDPDDATAVQEAFRQWLPDIEVVASAGHDWVSDPYSQQTWATFRSGQMSGGWRSFLSTSTRLIFAGADYAQGWNSFVDGAIESGITAARTIIGRDASGRQSAPAPAEAPGIADLAHV